jgi:cytochrome c biogenesis protein CcmG/thiol:disulfide interchange protein DsbE
MNGDHVPAGDAPVDEPQASPAAGTRRWWVFGSTVMAVAALVVVLGTGLGRDPSVVPARAVGGPAPELSGRTLDGGVFDLAGQRGNVVLVNVWASWCGPCEAELPVLNAAARGLGPRGLVVVGIDTQDDPEQAREFLAERGGSPYPSVDDSVGRAAVEWGTFGVPETFVVDRDGTVRARVVGEVSPAWIDQNVVPLLGG